MIALIESWFMLARVVDDAGDVGEGFEIKSSSYGAVRKRNLAAVSVITRENIWAIWERKTHIAISERKLKHLDVGKLLA
jgi:hypothetical protein